MAEHDNGGSRPIPDPTYLTTQQLIREQAGLKELVLSIVQGNFSVIDTRLAGMDRAIELVRVRAAEFPEYVREKVDQLGELNGETLTGASNLLLEKVRSLSDVTTQQFKSIDDRFSEKDKAVSVGLSAQKESAAAQQDSNNAASSKMEDNFTKLLDQGRDLLSEVRRNTELQINDIKSRVDRGEGKTSVSDPSISEAIRMMNTTLITLQDVAREGQGHSKGVEQSWGVIVAIASVGALVVFELFKH